jgi:hypothetical protein
MNPIRRYIKAVEKKLPGDRRSLVAAELGAALQAQRAELEKQLGRKANEDELEKLVGSLSPPEQAAERYGAPKGGYDLVERYLLSIQRKLPLGVPPYDILAELREGLTTKIEAKAEAEGREATTNEIAAILKEFGSPDVVAYRYRDRQALIGPELSPYFWTIQKVVIGVVFGIILIEAVIDGIGTTKPVSTVLRAVWSMWQAGIFTFGLVTLFFILNDGWAPKWRLDRLWNPRLLPETSIREPKSRFESLFGLMFDAMFILWWTGLVNFQTVGGWPDNTTHVGLAEAVWAPVHLPILVLAIMTAAVHFADLLHPGWSRARAVVAILGLLGGIAIVSLVSRAPELVTVTGPDLTPEGAAWRVYWITTVFRASLIVAAVFWAIEIAVEARRLVRSKGWRTGRAVAA